MNSLALLRAAGNSLFPDLSNSSLVMWWLMSPPLAMVVLLIVGAIALLRRRQSAMKMLRAWVVLQVLLAIAGGILGYLMIDSNVKYQERITDAVREMMVDRGESASAIPQQSEEEMRSGAVRGLMIGIPLQLVFPIVIGLLLTRKSWNEEVGTWDEAVT